MLIIALTSLILTLVFKSRISAPFLFCIYLSYLRNYASSFNTVIAKCLFLYYFEIIQVNITNKIKIARIFDIFLLRYISQSWPDKLFLIKLKFILLKYMFYMQEIAQNAGLELEALIGTNKENKQGISVTTGQYQLVEKETSLQYWAITLLHHAKTLHASEEKFISQRKEVDQFISCHYIKKDWDHL